MPKHNNGRDSKIVLFEKLVATHPQAVLKGATIPYTSVNGNMYSYFSKEGYLALRLPEEVRVTFLKKHKTTLVTSYGIVQKEYVVVPDSLLKKTTELKQYFHSSYKYVSSLKPKLTTKEKKA
jgi:hypothetical protein